MARSKGDGTLFKDSQGYWTARVELPPAADGSRRRKTIRSKDRGTAVKRLRDLRAELDAHGDISTSVPTLRVWAERWMKHTAPERVRPRTLATYQGYLDRWILPAIGRVRLDHLTTTHVEQMHDLMRTGYGEGKGKRRPLSSTSRLQAHRILGVILRDAVRAGHLRANPADRDHMEAPRKAATTTAVLTPEQAWTVLQHVAHDRLCARWAVALLGGLRQGEALGLERDAIDLEAGTITVRWQLQRLKGKPAEHVEHRDLGGGYYLTRPKTGSGMRVVPMAAPLLEVMRRHLEAIPAQQVAEHDLIFLTPQGRPIHSTGDTKRWRAILDEAKVPSVRLHDARHTTATMLLAAGVDAHVVQAIMGHSSVAMTHHYQHADLTMARDAMERMGKLLPAA